MVTLGGGNRTSYAMLSFKTSREKRYWLFAGIVYALVLISLSFGVAFQRLLWDPGIQIVLFLLGMLLTAITIVVYGLKIRPSKTELVVWLGFATVGVLVIFRLGAPERSHLMEYGVLAIFIYKAFTERFTAKSPLLPPLLALMLTSLLGALDEGIQFFMPNRVFDLEDILFNSLAALFAVGGSLILVQLRKWFRKTN